jgi:hypothetical protein
VNDFPVAVEYTSQVALDPEPPDGNFIRKVHFVAPFSLSHDLV